MVACVPSGLFSAPGHTNKQGSPNETQADESPSLTHATRCPGQDPFSGAQILLSDCTAACGPRVSQLVLRGPWVRDWLKTLATVTRGWTEKPGLEPTPGAAVRTPSATAKPNGQHASICLSALAFIWNDLTLVS